MHHASRSRTGAKGPPINHGKELGRATFGGRGVRLVRHARELIAVEIFTQNEGKLSNVLCTLRLTGEQLNRLADVLDVVATDVEEADGLDEGARDRDTARAENTSSPDSRSITGR